MNQFSTIKTSIASWRVPKLCRVSFNCSIVFRYAKSDQWESRGSRPAPFSEPIHEEQWHQQQLVYLPLSLIILSNQKIAVSIATGGYKLRSAMARVMVGRKVKSGFWPQAEGPSWPMSSGIDVILRVNDGRHGHSSIHYYSSKTL